MPNDIPSIEDYTQQLVYEDAEFTPEEITVLTGLVRSTFDPSTLRRRRRISRELDRMLGMGRYREGRSA